MASKITGGASGALSGVWQWLLRGWQSIKSFFGAASASASGALSAAKAALGPVGTAVSNAASVRSVLLYGAITLAGLMVPAVLAGTGGNLKQLWCFLGQAPLGLWGSMLALSGASGLALSAAGRAGLVKDLAASPVRALAKHRSMAFAIGAVLAAVAGLGSALVLRCTKPGILSAIVLAVLSGALAWASTR